MNVYVDSSILMRLLVGQARPFAGWESIRAPLASALIEVEVPRAIERLRAAGELEADAALQALESCRRALRAFRIIEIGPAVRLRAAGPFAGAIRTLDAIHLASALLWHEANPREELVLATHDDRLAKIARAHGLDVAG